MKIRLCQSGVLGVEGREAERADRRQAGAGEHGAAELAARLAITMPPTLTDSSRPSSSG